MRPLLLTLFALALITGSCKKDIPLSALPFGIKSFLQTHYPGKKMIRAQFMNYAPNGIYTNQSVGVTIPLTGPGSGVPVVSNNTSFNYGPGSNNNNLYASGFYIITLEGNILLEFTDKGFFIRRSR